MKGPKTNDRRRPLPRRTGHGDFPHPALARVVSSRKHSQRPEAQVFQVSIQTDAVPFSPAPLATPFQMAPQAVADEVVEIAERFARVAQCKIVGPASQVPIQPPNQFGQGCVALLCVNELSQRFSFPCHRLTRWPQVPVSLWPPIPVAVIPKGVAQKIQALAGLSQIQHASLLAVNLQVQPPFQLPFDPAAQPRADITGQYDKVVGIAYQLCFGPLRRSIRSLKQVVEPVQVEVGQQRTEHSALRRPSVVAPHRRRFPVLRRFHHRCLEPLSNQSQDRAVHHAHPYASDKLVLGYAVEVASQIRVIHRRLAFRQVRLDDAQRIVSRPAGPKPVRAILKVCLEAWLQYQQHRCLHQPVPHRRNAQRPQFSIGLGDIDPPHRLGAVGPLLQAPLNFGQKRRFAFRRRGNLLDAHSIYARRTVVVPHCRPSGLQHLGSVHQPVETIEAKSLLLFGFLSQLLSQFLEARRQDCFPKGKLLVHLFCRRSFHFNQLQLLLTRLDPGQGSLAPSRLNRNFPATMSPSDTAIRPRRRLWLPVRGFPRWIPNRVSQVPGGSFRARCLLSPRGVRSVPTVVASRTDAGFTSFGRLATPNMCNEAEPSSRDATARAFASPSLSEKGRPRSLRVRLHDFRPII